MAAFSTLALVGLGLAAGAASYSTLKDGKRGNTSTKVGQPGEGKRNPSDDAVYTGEKATTRSEYAASQATADAPTSTAELASANTTSAYAAGERARKRAAAGGSVLTGAQKGMAGPKGSATPKTLLGA